MITRRAFIGTLAGSLLAAPLAAEAEQAGKVYRIGYLGNQPSGPIMDAFLRGLRERGYVEGRNITIEYRWSQGNNDRFPALAAELASLKVEVIVAGGPVATRAAKQATTTVPIVAVASGDLLAEGLVTSLFRPGGNLTGLSFVAGPEIVGKEMQLLREVAPNISAIAFLTDATFPPPPVWRQELDVAATRLGLALSFNAYQSPDMLEETFAGIPKARATGLFVNGGPSEFLHRNRIITLAAKHRLPAVYVWGEAPRDGGLMSYGADLANLFFRAATYIDKILKGAKPGDLAIEQPIKFNLVINLKTTKALGLTIPQSLLLRADQIIE